MEEKLASHYPAHLEMVRHHYERALADHGYDSVVIFGGAQQMIFLDDNPYPFKVNPHLKYWVPVVDNPNCFLTFRPGEKPRLVFYKPVDFWHKAAPAPEGYWVSEVDIAYSGSLEEAQTLLPGEGRIAFIGEIQALSGWGIGEANPPEVLDQLHYHRAWKSEYEIECMRQANALGVRAHRAAEEAFRSGASEFEVHLAYLRASSQNEAQLPYGNIIAFNENAAVLHYQHQERVRPAEVRSFLIDAGASVNGYASDITRTYATGKNEFSAMIDSMDRAQQELMAELRPGVDYRDLQSLTHRKVGAILEEFGIVSVSGDEAAAKGVTRAFFPHGVGHYIGLQVHDVGGFLSSEGGETIPRPDDQPFLRLTRTIEENQVFTIEPGLYFIDPLLEELQRSENSGLVRWDRVEAFRPFGGVRIEDDVRVTATGCENLTREQFAAIE
jgi:Xaa-Pro dipeptidase